MPNPVIEIYPGAIERMEMSGGQIDNYCRATALKVAEEAALLAPRKTGELAASIRARRVGLFWTVEAIAPYALFVEEGTRPHDITPKGGGVLRFPTRGGMVVYTKAVRHPGTKGRHFLEEALATVVHA